MESNKGERGGESKRGNRENKEGLQLWATGA